MLKMHSLIKGEIKGMEKLIKNTSLTQHQKSKTLFQKQINK